MHCPECNKNYDSSVELCEHCGSKLVFNFKTNLTKVEKNILKVIVFIQRIFYGVALMMFLMMLVSMIYSIDPASNMELLQPLLGFSAVMFPCIGASIGWVFGVSEGKILDFNDIYTKIIIRVIAPIIAISLPVYLTKDLALDYIYKDHQYVVGEIKHEKRSNGKFMQHYFVVNGEELKVNEDLYSYIKEGKNCEFIYGKRTHIVLEVGMVQDSK